MDEGQRPGRQRPAVLDFDGRVLWRRACTLMSMMSNRLMPSACETDIAGLVGMYAMVLASGKPSAIVDWNNNYADDPDKGVIFHCSNLPKDIFVEESVTVEDVPHMDYQAIIAGRWARIIRTARSWAVSRRRRSPIAASRPMISTARCWRTWARAS